MSDADTTALEDEAPGKVYGRPSFQWLRVHFALVIREMTTTYSRNTGGYAWAIIEPLGAIMVLSIVFAALVRTPSLGTSFVLFYATGYLPFQMYTQIQQSMAGGVSFNRALMQYPAVTPIDAVFARCVLNILTHGMVSVILLTSVVQILDLQINLDMRPILIAFGMAALLGAGIGSVNSVLFCFYPSWQRVWGIISRPLFLISGVFYLPEELPIAARNVLEWNPLMHIVAESRTGFYGAYHADFVSIPYVTGIGAGTLVVGLYLLRQNKSALINPRF